MKRLATTNSKTQTLFRSAAEYMYKFKCLAEEEPKPYKPPPDSA